METESALSTALLDEIVAYVSTKGTVEQSHELVAQLVEALDRDEQSLSRKDSRVSVRSTALFATTRLASSPLERQDTIFDNTFALFDFLVPLISTDPTAEPLQVPVKRCLASVARYSSPREILMAVEEQLRALLPRVSIWAGSGPDTDDKLNNSPSRYAALLAPSTIGELLHTIVIRTAEQRLTRPYRVRSDSPHRTSETAQIRPDLR